LEVSTVTLSNIKPTSLTISVAIKGLIGGDQVEEHGFVYSSIHTLPDYSDEIVRKGSLSSNESFTATIANLQINTTYYIRGFVQKEGIRIFSKEATSITLPSVPINFLPTTIDKQIGRVIIKDSISGLESLDRIDTYGHVWSNEHKLPTVENANVKFFGNLQANDVEFETIIPLNDLVVLDSYYVRSFIQSGNVVIYSDQVAKFVKGDEWRQLTDFNNPFSVFHAFSFTIDGALYIYENRNKFGKYNFKTKDWTPLAPFERTINGNTRTFVIGKKAYVGTGDIKIDNKWITTDSLWEYDSEKNSWSAKANFSGGIRRSGISFSIGQKGYMGFGEDTKGFFYDLYEYDPTIGEKGEWELVSSEYKGEKNKLPVYFSLEDKGCVGLVFQGSKSDCWCYQPGSGWVEYAPLPANTSNFQTHKFFSIGKRGFVVLPDITENFWEFDSELESEDGKKGKWIKRMDFPGIFERRGPGFKGDQKGYVGTSDDLLWEYAPEVN